MLKNLITAGFVAGACFLAPSPAPAQISISIRIGPPALPVYVQPPCPTEGYLWTPGYWAYAPAGYYWVPGVWVSPPRIGVLWTPGYWGFAGGLYGWHAGYWGPHVGFYGGVNYGFGYVGHGFVGGTWAGGAFRYNTAVMNVNTSVIHNTYVDRTVINNTNISNNRASFNGPGGVNERPTPQERAFNNEQHFQPTQNQMAHEQSARQDRTQFASVNHGHPQNASMERVGDRVGGSHFNPQAHNVNQRAGEQQQRIEQGVVHGQMTPGQTRNIENREQHINQQVHADRKADNGHLTQQEHRQVNREQNHASEKIHEDKHEAHEPHERR